MKVALVVQRGVRGGQQGQTQRIGEEGGGRRRRKREEREREREEGMAMKQEKRTGMTSSKIFCFFF